LHWNAFIRVYLQVPQKSLNTFVECFAKCLAKMLFNKKLWQSSKPCQSLFIVCCLFFT